MHGYHISALSGAKSAHRFIDFAADLMYNTIKYIKGHKFLYIGHSSKQVS
jgi:hypothetical protein